MFLTRRIPSVMRVLALFFVAFLALCGVNVQPAQAGSYSSTDFIVAGYYQNAIAIYDQNWNFKSYLDSHFPAVSGLDILPNGNVVAAGHNREVRIYAPSGALVGSFFDNAVGDPIDIKASSNNLLYIATQKAASSAKEFNLAGTPLRTFGSKSYDGLAVLPNNILWAGGDEYAGIIDVYDLSSGSYINTIALDNGQQEAESFFYSRQTNTVLITDTKSDAIYERTTSGAFVRKFVPVGDSLSDSFGVTRGPNGDVYATDYDTSKVFYWNSSGTHLGSYGISDTASGPCNIIWMGNANTFNSSVNAAGTLKNADGSIQASLWAAYNKNGLGGSLSYTDKYNKITVQSTKVTGIVVQENQAFVSGECKVNGQSGYTFTATTTDYYPSFLGRGDSLQLQVSNGYTGGGVFNPGDAKVTGPQGLILVP